MTPEPVLGEIVLQGRQWLGWALGLSALARFALLGITFASAQACMASDYPNKPIKMVIPYTPGGSIDTVGRTTGVLAHLEAELGTESAEETLVARGQSAAFVLALEAPPSREEVELMIDATLADLGRSLAGDARG